MSRMLAPKLALARAAGGVSRLLADRRFGRFSIGGGGTSLPGKLLVRMDADAIASLSARLTRGSVLISATNGKTTTAALAASIFERADIALVHNQAGANMAGGIASTLLEASRRDGRIAGELGLFEVDEFWLDRLIGQLTPAAIVLGNLFRDQLDRYGELDTIAERWQNALATTAGQRAQLVCNADDPLLADLARERETIFFGVEDDSLSLAGMSHAADAKHCHRCGAPYIFEAIYLGHLGRYHCAACGQRRPSPTVLADQVELRILLVKNPAGANEVLRTLALEPGEHDLLCVLNDRTADGHDVSWIWDADFELLSGRIARAVCSGTRAPELALRFKYAGVEPSRIEVVEGLAGALDRAVAGGEVGKALYVLPTYTAMLSLRELLVDRGEARSSWR